MNAATMPFTERIKQNFNWSKITLALVLLAMTGWIINEARIRFPIRSHGMSEYTKNLKTVCVGRYLWDVPQSAQLGTISQTINGISIARMPDQALSDDLREMSLAQYERNLRKELEKLEYSGIKEVRPFSKNGKLFLFQHESPTGGVLNAHAYVGVGRVIYKLSTKFAIEYKNESIDDLEKIANTLRPRAADEIPTEPGLCIDGGFAAGKGFDQEMAAIDFMLPDYPGFGVSFGASIENEPSDSEKMNTRVIRSWTNGGALNDVSIKRKASINILGQAGHELMFTTDDKGRHSLSAEAEIWGNGTVSKQGLSFTMENNTYHPEDRTPYPKILPDDSAINIWDAMLKTVRVRAGAM